MWAHADRPGYRLDDDRKIGDNFWTNVKILAWFRPSTATQMRFALFRNLTRRRLVILHRRFGTTYRSKPQGSSSPRRRWDWKVLLKRLSRITNLCCVRSQNSADLVKIVSICHSVQTDFEVQTGLGTLWAFHLWRFTSAHKLVM